MHKPLEFWVALAVGVLVVFHRNAEKSRTVRVTLAAISGGMAYSLAPEIADWTGRSETLAAMVVGAFGYLFLDFGAALLSDREFLKEVIMKRLGK